MIYIGEIFSYLGNLLHHMATLKVDWLIVSQKVIKEESKWQLKQPDIIALYPSMGVS